MLPAPPDILPCPPLRRCLAALWPRRRLLQLYDSMPSPGSGLAILQVLQRWYAEDCADKAELRPPGLAAAESLRLEVVTQGVPRQGDGSACGVFSCAFAELLARGVLPPFEFSQVRRVRLTGSLVVHLRIADGPPRASPCTPAQADIETIRQGMAAEMFGPHS